MSTTELPEAEITLWHPHPNQWAIAEDKSRFKMVVCGRRFGKTTLAVNLLIEEALVNPNALCFYIAPTYRQAKMIAWRMLNRSIQQLPQHFVKRTNESELYAVIGNNSRIDIKGADNPDSLRGVGLNACVLDEAADMKENVFEEIIRPALTETKGWCLFIGTPKGYNHFYERYQKAQTMLDWKTWHFTSYDNPLLDPEEIDSAKAQLGEDFFAQEYLAEFRQYVGLVYKEFDREIHVKKDLEINSSWAFYRAVDFGYHNPTAFLWIGIDYDDTIYVYDEVYVNEMTTNQIAEAVLVKSGGQRFTATYGDPSAAQLIADYRQLGITITPALKEPKTVHESWVEAGINRIAEFLKKSHRTGKPRLVIDAKCVNLIREFELYSWQEKPENKNEPRMPKKENDHALDALRYFMVSYRPGAVRVRKDAVRQMLETQSNRRQQLHTFE